MKNTEKFTPKTNTVPIADTLRLLKNKHLLTLKKITMKAINENKKNNMLTDIAMSEANVDPVTN